MQDRSERQIFEEKYRKKCLFVSQGLVVNKKLLAKIAKIFAYAEMKMIEV